MKICPSCKKKFTDDKKFCNEDGSELITFEMSEENLEAGSEFKPARIMLKAGGNLTGKFFDLTSNSLIVGRFDSSTGPIEIDVSGLPGAEHISRKHAKFTFEKGKWFVSDLGSTNGVFIKRGGAAEFSPRLVEPAELNSGDEVSFGNVVFLFGV